MRNDDLLKAHADLRTAIHTGPPGPLLAAAQAVSDALLREYAAQKAEEEAIGSLLADVSGFIAGFKGDELQDGVPDALAQRIHTLLLALGSAKVPPAGPATSQTDALASCLRRLVEATDADIFTDAEEHTDSVEAVQCARRSALRLLKGDKLRPYTVIAYRDGDKGVDTYSEHVWAVGPADAWEAFIDMQDDGDVREGATEIVTFDGHLQQA